MNRLAIVAPAAAAAILCTLPVLAQEKPNQNGFVTLELNWAEGDAPAESQLDGDAMRQILERDEARVRMIQQRVKPLNDAPKADEKKDETKTVTTPVAPPDESRNGGLRTISADQMRQILERDRARARAIGERVRAAQAVVYMHCLSADRSSGDRRLQHHCQGDAVCAAGKADQKMSAFRQTDPVSKQ